MGWKKKPVIHEEPKIVELPPPPPPLQSENLFFEFFQVVFPVLLVVVGMTLIYYMSGRFFKGRSREGFLTLYFCGALAMALHLLVTSGDALSLYHAFAALSGTVKYAASMLLVSFVFFSARLLPSVSAVSVPSELANAVAPIPELSECAGGGPINLEGEKLNGNWRVNYPTDLDWKGDTKTSFVFICDTLIYEILEDLRVGYDAIPEQIQWIKEMLEYNVKGGKMNRGLGVIDVYKAFASQSGHDLSDYEYCRAAVLGWCIEWVQAFFLVADDFMDESQMRRSQPCWYRLPHVKQVAINDAFILESLVYRVLRRHFSHEPYYLQLVEVFHDVVYRTEMGQLLDLTSQPLDKPPDFSRFTATRYELIVKYKTSFYTFYLPCAIGMICHGITDSRSFELSRQICAKIGEYFQVQDDYLDCYGDPEVTGKVGTDIQDMKCSWLVVQALDRCSAQQREQLKENYGKDEAKKIVKVKMLYTSLGLNEAYAEYEEKCVDEIKALIAEVKDVPKDIYNFFVRRIYLRQK